MSIKLYNTRGRLVDIESEADVPTLLAKGFVRAQLGAKPYNPLLDRGAERGHTDTNYPDPRKKKAQQVKIIGETLDADLIE